MLRTLWFVSEQLGTPSQGEERRGFCFYKGKPGPLGEACPWGGFTGSRNGKNLWDHYSQAVAIPGGRGVSPVAENSLYFGSTC